MSEELDEPDLAELHRAVLRERAEPIEGREPVPVWMGLAFGLLIAWGGWYLGRHDAAFDPLRSDLEPLLAAGPVSAAPPSAEADARGAALYAGRCVACHQADGRGLAHVAPPLDGSEWVTGDPVRLTRVVLHGLTGPIEVAGQPWSGAMPAWGASMTDEEIAAVLTHLRASWSNAAPPVSADEVRAVRQADARSAPWTAAEL